MVAYIKFTYGKHGGGGHPTPNPKPNPKPTDWLKEETNQVGIWREAMAETVRDFVYLRHSAGNFCLDRFFYFCHIN